VASGPPGLSCPTMLATINRLAGSGGARWRATARPLARRCARPRPP
jgi:hypothetical protein